MVRRRTRLKRREARRKRREVDWRSAHRILESLGGAGVGRLRLVWRRIVREPWPSRPAYGTTAPYPSPLNNPLAARRPARTLTWIPA
jgi:hypothetical protein